MSVVISVVFYFFLRSIAVPVVWEYCEAKQIVLTELEQIQTDFLIEGGSLIVSVLLFAGSFLFFLGQKFAYLQVILQGIEALRIHRMDYSIPEEGNNEFTELAKSINYLSRTERELNEKENLLRKERELLIRALSHDIRTPLTSIRSYSEMMEEKMNKGEFTPEEMKEYVQMMRRKADQMKELTDQLLENSKRNPEQIDDGKLFMEQLVSEWEEMLEDRFELRLDLSECPDFSGEIDVREFQRIFDNLQSNIIKYADKSVPVEMKIISSEGRLSIFQKNKKKMHDMHEESHKIGLLSIRAMAGNYGGDVTVFDEEDCFEILIRLLEI